MFNMLGLLQYARKLTGTWMWSGRGVGMRVVRHGKCCGSWSCTDKRRRAGTAVYREEAGISANNGTRIKTRNKGGPGSRPT